jgi:hypothetical protein
MPLKGDPKNKISRRIRYRVCKTVISVGAQPERLGDGGIFYYWQVPKKQGSYAEGKRI